MNTGKRENEMKEHRWEREGESVSSWVEITKEIGRRKKQMSQGRMKKTRGEGEERRQAGRKKKERKRDSERNGVSKDQKKGREGGGSEEWRVERSKEKSDKNKGG